MKRIGLVIVLGLLISTLSACKEKEIEVHVHNWQPATYEGPEYCECGRTRGEALPAFAIERGIIPDMKVGVKYPFYATTLDKPEITAKGSVKITDFRIVESEGENFKARDDYEWRIADIEFLFDSIEVYRYGVSYDFLVLDYYQEMVYTEVFYIQWQGKSYSCNQYFFENSKWQKNTFVAKWVYGIRVPKGYDGGLMMFCGMDFFLSIIDNDQEGKFSELAGDKAHSFRMTNAE